jgi:hypothetical protein
MSEFQDAVVSVPVLERAYRKGLQGLRGADRDRVLCRNPRGLTGSLGLDEHLASILPNEPRWDYAIGYRAQGGEQVYWIEVHPASSSHVDEVLAKLKWLRAWLTREAPRLAGLPATHVWIATGRVAIRRGSQQQRLLAQAGITSPRQRLEL